ncbi:MAG TPA: GMC family oxidoreductase N-terminal domain-containing protein [Polyangia bacterium]|nr:GMC family oxidoreductase N-terminal domain-containing protein [Polyangia bacterium]
MLRSPAAHGLFSEHERRCLLAMARIVIPAGRLLPAPGARTLARLEQLIATLGAAGQGYRALLLAFEAHAYARHRRGFADLDEEAAERLIDDWQQASYARRTLLRALVTPLKVAHYDDPAFYRELGCVYRAPAVTELRPRWMTERVHAAGELAGETLECDVVVIGTGAGGAVVAKELAQGGLGVVMVEEGDYYTRSDFTGGVVEMQQKLYRGAGALWALGNTAIPIPLGKTVGGTTTINSGTCYRTPERVFAEWRERHGLAEFSSEQMAPYYERVEEVLQVRRAEARYLGGVARLVARGCDVLGYRHQALLRNAPDCDGQGVCCFGCPTDAKRSTNVSYVPLALQRGATLVKGLRVDSILIEGGRAVGVSGVAQDLRDDRSTRNLRGPGEEHRGSAAQGTKGEGKARVTVRARAVVVACGSLLTPLLLEENHLGLGSGQLGRNLTIHPATALTALFDEQVEGYRGIPQGYAIEEFHDEGILFEGIFGPPEMGAATITLLGRRFVEVMESYDRLASFGFMIEDTSSGRVRRGPGGRPIITYVVNDNDVSRLKRGVDILGRVFFAAGAKKVYTPIHGFDELSHPEELERLRQARVHARDFQLSAYHPLGTARMGLSPRHSVVDPDHQVHDLPGLYVADGSVMPSSLAVNPQLTIMALATRAADRLTARLS